MTKRTIPDTISNILPALILLLGATLRLYCLGSMPGGMHQDESFVAWNAFALFHEGMDSAGHTMPIYFADWGDGHSAMYVWLLQPLLALNGGEITSFISRLPQAIVSIFTLCAVYGIVRRISGRPAALISMLALAICPWHIMMSRWGLDANLAPGFLMFGFYFFIRGLERERYLLLSGLFYGLSLYCYAVIWPVVPVMLLLQIAYGLYHKKLFFNRCSVLASCILFVLALPLILFVLVNSEILPEISLPFLTIPKMGGYRGGEIAFRFSEMYANLRTALSLLYHQNTGAPQDVLLPYGLFYDIGRLFIILGAFCLVISVLKSFWKREFTLAYFMLVQLVGGGLNCLLVTAVLHQINSLYIPLVLCEGYGIWQLLRFCHQRKRLLGQLARLFLFVVFAQNLICFQKDYYTQYRTLTDAYFANGIEQCVDYAWEQCDKMQLNTITVEKGAQWPRLLLHTETLPSEYLSTVIYDEAPAPASFEKNGIRIRTRIHYDAISQDSIYILYFTDASYFEQDFTLTPFYDWYVAVPKKS